MYLLRPVGYAVSADGRSITCDQCGRTSHHPDDVAALYCGACKIFHEDESRWCEGGCGLLLVRVRVRGVHNPVLPRFCTECQGRRR